jgi:hypothetical protein
MLDYAITWVEGSGLEGRLRGLIAHQGVRYGKCELSHSQVS